MKMGSSQPPGGVAHPARPDQGAPALGQERQVTLSVSSPFMRYQTLDHHIPMVVRTWPCVSALQRQNQVLCALVTRAENVVDRCNGVTWN